jgi:hypothetical protein
MSLAQEVYAGAEEIDLRRLPGSGTLPARLCGKRTEAGGRVATLEKIMKTKPGLLVVLLAVAAMSGCAKKEKETEVIDVEGTVEKIDLPGRAVVVRTYNRKHDREIRATVHVTDDTEILINGALAKLSDVKVGETAFGTVKIIKRDEVPRYVAVRVRVERGDSGRARRPRKRRRQRANPRKAPAGSRGKQKGRRQQGRRSWPSAPLIHIMNCWPPPAASLELLADRLGLHEELEVVSPAGLGVGAGHIEAAEGLDVDQSPSALAVEV